MMAKKKKDAPLAPDNAMKEFDKTLLSLVGKYERWRLFSDFVAMGAYAFGNAIVKNEKHEQIYMDIVKRYSKDEANTLASLLGMVTVALDTDEPHDVLGDAFMRLELSSHWHGQFFTPYAVASMMAQMTIGDRARALKRMLVEEKDYISVGEPACGAGVMIIAFVNALRRQGIEPQRHVYVEAQDLDATAAHMTMIQLSLLHIPATVIVGDTLAMERRDVFYTPAFHLGMWPLRLRQRPPVTRTPVK
jgi:type I restriction-modification system DNA methylase subunit